MSSASKNVGILVLRHEVAVIAPQKPEAADRLDRSGYARADKIVETPLPAQGRIRGYPLPGHPAAPRRRAHQPKPENARQACSCGGPETSRRRETGGSPAPSASKRPGRTRVTRMTATPSRILKWAGQGGIPGGDGRCNRSYRAPFRGLFAPVRGAPENPVSTDAQWTAGGPRSCLETAYALVSGLYLGRRRAV